MFHLLAAFYFIGMFLGASYFSTVFSRAGWEDFMDGRYWFAVFNMLATLIMSVVALANLLLCIQIL